jgi:hypothetical protein
LPPRALASLTLQKILSRTCKRKEEGGRRKEEGGRRKEEGGRRKEDGG